MKKQFFFLLIALIFISLSSSAQNATLKGIILNENNVPVQGANITFDNSGTQSDENGVYELTIPANQEVQINVTHIALKSLQFTIKLEENQEYELNPVLKTNVEQISTVIISGRERKTVEGITTLDPETIRTTPSANAGVEGLLKSLPGVSSNNELSTQYSVRGGNYDENLVYVNEIEVYRPFLIRSGQQEGLSFVNTDLVRNVDFSAGGFQAKYGDKLSSVLDITYKRPTRIGASVNMSLLGGSISAGGISKNKKLSGIVGVRYRDNSLLVDARNTETNFQPLFADVQTYLSYNFSDKFELGFLGNLAINKYDYEPLREQVNFGTLQTVQALVVNYQGQEEDQYDTYFGALKGTFRPNNNLTLKLIASGYQTQEQEYYDILASYALGTVNTDIGSEDLGDIEFAEGVGSQLTHARNDLDALIFNIQHKGTYTYDNHQFDWGIKYTSEDIKDRLQEYEIIDSAGFSIRPPIRDLINDQPYTPFESPIVPFVSVRATNEVTVDRISGYAQYSLRSNIKENEIWANLGVRAHNWNISGNTVNPSNSQVVISPRAQFAIKPNWKTDMIFRVSGGLYHQPPFYRELRDSLGVVRPNVKAQQSIHLVVGNDYSFNMWNRPFKLTSEIYYKKLTDVNPYTIENVRIRYRARNNAEAYAQGVDVRLNGEFVPGTESWVSIGYLKTEENIDDRGYISRPTDQRLKIGVLLQDYVPSIPSLKGYLNLVYQTGVPGGSPSYADPYDFQSRLRDYRRADLGVSYVVVDANKRLKQGNFFNNFEELSLGLEIYNLFDNQNSITNTFVRDAASQRQFAIPNFLTPRVFNVRVGMKF
ncbi:carboxypeptidase-like regulatory domain-containing protein [Aquimarina gracilis]|uniref:Carboxypeptidase-like regulatory domain-containing protein n=1 Tax=Aquimarina gracilis TaxID=874422 RepID=A0ABU6A1A4_9FLAO|nr:carboxypeptidase-like regulatory domain-containing protein [Aquimarina gracilis]MEB3347938.1 carboxypeptidase-like regulatory domain-containing protein [Aquimarina gracilis]